MVFADFFYYDQFFTEFYIHVFKSVIGKIRNSYSESNLKLPKTTHYEYNKKYFSG